MNAAVLPVGAVLGSGLAIGVAGNYLLRSPGGPGLNFPLLFAGLAVSLWVLSRRAEVRISLEAAVWVGVGLFFALGFAWRGSPSLQALAFLSAGCAFSLPALHAGAAWMRRAGVTDLLEAIAGCAVQSAFGAARLVGNEGWRGGTSPTRVRPVWRQAREVARGVLLATPLLVVFGALLISADEIFAGIVRDLVWIDLGTPWSHAVGIGVLSWLTAGYLTGALTGTAIRERKGTAVPAVSLGIVEVGITLALLDLLFLGFVLVQFRYLFGGSSLVEVTPGLTYAEYAREGFFQLVAAVCLVLPLLLTGDWLLARPSRREARVFRVLTGIQLFLLLVIVASAFQRMRVYQGVFGLTELRFFVTALLVWLAVLVLWFGATVLRGRREVFASGALVSAFALVAGLHIVNPDALIARTNLHRAGEAVSMVSGSRSVSETPASVDVAYLNSLSSDAVPALLEGLADLPDGAQRAVAQRLLRSWGPDSKADWRSWNWSAMHARGAVQAAARLLGLAAQGTSPGRTRECQADAVGFNP